MAYGQQTALTTQTTVISVSSSAWTAMEATAAHPSTQGATTALPKRFAVKVYNRGTAGASRIGLSYDNTVSYKHSNHYLGAGQHRVEPAATGTTLYGRAKLASGISTILCVVVEYGH